MKGDGPRLLRALLARLSWGALAFSLFSLCFYLAAAFRRYTDDALFLALRACSLGSAMALGLALSAALVDLASPLFKARIRVPTLLWSALTMAFALAMIVITGILRASFSGLRI